MGWLESVSSIGSNIAIILIAIVIIAAIIAIIVVLYNNWRKYQQFECEIYQKDGLNQWRIKHDNAGIFINSQNNKMFFLQRHGVGLSPDNVPYVVTESGKKKVMILQTGLKNFRYITPQFIAEITGTDKDGNTIEIDPANIVLTVGEEDVNWAVNDYEMNKKRFGQTWLAQYLPFIMLAFVCVIILVLFINLFNKFPVMLDMIKEMKEVALALAQAKSGTTVIA